ncbi:hypothetical protein KKC67_00160 [Patescibacteria group bacterium]|nr:hypothetical protein [Patescibacteria group bacterium]MBU0879651.1 hypothetical protein [Patescibacteria group bacterium]MBU0880205.1 hypothetical protein [Patescibacteria group bacterium]MBU0897946.1 hypothetical protein [Patescibacteria group bacterium]MBU1063094.1 hypothetical protein [Patescibacteria group bacterium]
MKFSITKITHRIISRYIYSLLIIFIIATLSYLFLFLYKNFYQAIIQTKETIILKEKVAKEIININEFNKVIDKLNQKVTLPKITSNLNNPFD